MNIAIPTNNRTTVAEKSGRAKEFVIIEYVNGKILSKKYLENNHEHTHHNAIGHNGKDNTDHGHGDLVQLLEGVSLIIGKKFGPHFGRDFHTAGVKLVITKQDLIEDALESLDL